ncbi:protein TIC 40, chloroplastic [Rhododendron vialii]|uniref:protein TIC 40, chloroplastic n=1 Tax=Rhododendron vialii TaxID=182163 RepID=UPI00265DF533|nr:protein TIC 40, chloroplastic [Rhododendron vialii]
MMESLALVSSPKMVLGCSAKPKDMVSGRYPFGLPRQFHNTRRIGLKRPTTSISAFNPPQSNHGRTPVRLSKSNVLEKLGREGFASITSSNSQETSSVGVNPPLIVPPPPSYFGSPLFWVGVGVGLSALFSWVVSKLKEYAMQQAYKTLTGQMRQNNPFNNAAFSPGSPSPWPTPLASGPATSPPFPTAPTSRPATSTSPATTQSTVTVDVTATDVEAPPATDVKDNTELKQPKKSAFVDISLEETLQRRFEDTIKWDSTTDDELAGQVSQNGAASTPGFGASSEGSSSQKTSSPLSVEALEKMMEDPTVQKMVYPYLPEEMRNPTTFKWMLQNPQYRQQLEDMLNNMGGSAEWDNRMMDSLKKFDLSSPEVKQQFDQIGLTPEEVISKIMANPDIAMAFQNPRVQAAIMDCSQNPMSIAKYQNDKEVMDVFNKISELFPGATGSF